LLSFVAGPAGTGAALPWLDSERLEAAVGPTKGRRVRPTRPRRDVERRPRTVERTRPVEAKRTADFVPHGFADARNYRAFSGRAHEGLAKAGYADAKVFMRGSAVTGESYRKGEPFDVGRKSDFDLAVVSPSLNSRARQAGVLFENGRSRPLTNQQAQGLGVARLRDSLSGSAQRQVTFMLYEHENVISARGPYAELPR
jgi:hypothetical protein